MGSLFDTGPSSWLLGYVVDFDFVLPWNLDRPFSISASVAVKVQGRGTGRRVAIKGCQVVAEDEAAEEAEALDGIDEGDFASAFDVEDPGDEDGADADDMAPLQGAVQEDLSAWPLRSTPCCLRTRW